MKLLTIIVGLSFASALLAAGEPEWCDAEKNSPMERRGLGCLESCTKWRESRGLEVSEPDCPPENYQYYTFEDADYGGKNLVCIVKVECVSSGSP